MASFGGLALLPDADVAGVSLRLAEDHSLYGHRGYSHSLLFAATITLLAWVCARRWGTRPLYTALLAFMAVASHGILDAMTYATRGIPFFWPLTDMRFAFPWRPIPPAPTGVAFLSRRGLEVAGVEIVYFGPLALAACAPALGWWRQQLGRLASWRKANGVMAAVTIPVFTPTRGAFRVAGIIATVAVTMAAAQVYLRNSPVVAWIEQSTQENVAVSMAARRSNRHMR
jgi:inner membrane protein